MGLMALQDAAGKLGAAEGRRSTALALLAELSEGAIDGGTLNVGPPPE